VLFRSTKYYRPDENSANATISYYSKGALVALALDLTLRSEGPGTLDAVMRGLWQRACARSEAAGGAPGQGGPIDEARYLKLLAKTINQVLGSPGRAVQSVAEASFDAWTKYYRPDENTANATISYYTKGALVALALDLTLRSEGTGVGECTLDAVMRGLWQRACARSEAAGAAAGQGGPIDEADIAALLRQVGGRDFAPELAAWVHGTGDLPLERLLAAVALRWSREAPTLAQKLGARSSDGPGGPTVQSVLRGGWAERVGLAAGDELLALDGWRLGKIDDLMLYGAFDASGTRALPLLVARDRRLLTLDCPAGAPAVEGAVTLAPQPEPAADARQRREAWLAPIPA
jgi:predicted metalloprotease with PDZ domain